MIRGSWIPPVPLALGAIFSAVSWILVIAYAFDPSFGIALAWVHAVALGAFTTIALSVLVHVIPGFTDLTWRFEKLARWCAVALPFAAVGFVASFLIWNTAALAVFGSAAAIAIVCYVVVAVATLVQPTAEPAEGAIARAMIFVLVFLALAAALGAAIAIAFTTGAASMLRFAPVHASFALVGWLTMLTMGVSARTLRPILRSTSRWRPLHILSNTGMMGCAIVAAAGFTFGQSIVVTVGFALGLISAIAYATDGFDRVARATSPHRPAHVFVAAALVWLLLAACAATLGRYDVAVAIALAGWLGQMINAHLHHLGIRVIATTIAGDESEVRPWELLDLNVEWFTAIAAQGAVVALVIGVMSTSALAFGAAAILGLAATAGFATNVLTAIRKTPELA